MPRHTVKRAAIVDGGVRIVEIPLGAKTHELVGDVRIGLDGAPVAETKTLTSHTISVTVEILLDSTPIAPLDVQDPTVKDALRLALSLGGF